MSVPRSRAFSFYLSCDINLQVQVRVSDLQILSSQLCNNTQPASLYVAVWICEGGEIRGQPVRTTYVEASQTGAVWGEWLQLPLKYRDLASSAGLCAAVWRVELGQPEAAPALLGGTVLSLFSKKGRLKTGPQRLQVWPGRAPCMQQPSTTPGRRSLKDSGNASVQQHKLTLLSRGDLPAVPWLDPLVTAQVAARVEAEHTSAVECAATAAAPPSCYLVIDLPVFPHAVLYQQPVGYAAAAAASVMSGSSGGSGASELVAWKVGGGEPEGKAGLLAGLVCLLDPEVGRDNPSELKAQKLARSLARGLIDRDLKPNTEERRRIAALLRAPPNKPLSAEDHSLLWRFRFALQQEHRALPKFLQVVDWRDSGEVRQAQELMSSWAPATTADGLELLSPTFSAIDEVRGHAVNILTAKEDEELLSVLLQLVQALRYESSDVSRLSRFLVSRAAANPQFAITLHWYLAVEVQDPVFGQRADHVLNQLYGTLQRSSNTGPGGVTGKAVCDAITAQRELLAQLKHVVVDLKSLRLKAARATQRMQEVMSASGACGELTTMHVPLPLDPSLTLAGVIPLECFVFKSAQLPLKLHFKVEPTRWDSLSTGHHMQRQGHPQQPAAAAAVGQPGHVLHPTPSYNKVTGTGAHTSGPGDSHTMSSSSSSGQHGRSVAHQLAELPSTTGVVVQGGELRCCLIYKKGDDLRQDQFVLQMIGLMDRLLKRDNLDLRMTPYKVLPTSSDDGLVEYVPSMPLSKVLAEHKTIRRYLGLQGGEDPNGPLGLRADILETFVRSAAGACVATYILGVGDRHLDNLLLCSDGRLFHIDFGYILGADPKPFPPPMKICKEMVEAMGGHDSPWYAQFRTYACEAYNILRKNADLMLSLFHLMEGSAIEALRGDPEKALLKLQDKLRLDLDDEAAVAWMTGLLMESATALMPQIVETTHRWAQYWR